MQLRLLRLLGVRGCREDTAVIVTARLEEKRWPKAIWRRAQCRGGGDKRVENPVAEIFANKNSLPLL